MPQKDALFRVVPESGLSRRAEVLILLAASLLFLILALRTFGPDSVYTHFHSDGAILILMANDDRPITIFDTYYYASDRWGTWPLIIAKTLHQNIGLYWTAHTLHYARTISIFLALLILAALNARAAPAVIATRQIVEVTRSSLLREWAIRIRAIPQRTVVKLGRPNFHSSLCREILR